MPVFIILQFQKVRDSGMVGMSWVSGGAITAMEAGLGLSGQLWFPADLVPFHKGLSMAGF